MFGVALIQHISYYIIIVVVYKPLLYFWTILGQFLHNLTDVNHNLSFVKCVKF